MKGWHTYATSKHVSVIDRTPTAIELGASSIRPLVRSEATAGRISILEYGASERFTGPPLHVHPDYDEVFYVLEGTALLSYDGARVEATAREGVYVPGTSPHTFGNPGDAPLRMLIVVTPGGVERFFEEYAALGGVGVADPADVEALWSKYGMSAALGSEPVGTE